MKTRPLLTAPRPRCPRGRSAAQAARYRWAWRRSRARAFLGERPRRGQAWTTTIYRYD